MAGGLAEELSQTSNEGSNEPSQQNTFDFKEHISQDYRDGVNKFSSVDDLAKSYVNLEKKLGSSVSLPLEGSTPETKEAFFNKIKDIPNVLIKPEKQEDYGEFYSKLGRPEKADGYDINDLIAPELLEDSNLIDEISTFKEEAFNLGLSNDQVRGLLAMRMNWLQESVESYNQNGEEGLKVLHEKWGNDFDANMNAAKETVKYLKGRFPAQIESLIENEGNNPLVSYLLAELGHSYKEKGMVGAPKVSFGETPESAQQKIKANNSNKEFVDKYINQHVAGHKEAVEEMNRLYAIAYNK